MRLWFLGLGQSPVPSPSTNQLTQVQAVVREDRLSLPAFLTCFWPPAPLCPPPSYRDVFSWRVLSPLVTVYLKIFNLCFGLSHRGSLRLG